MSRIAEVKALMSNPSFALHLDGVKKVREEGQECVSKRYALTRELEDRECRKCLPSKKYKKIWDRTPKFAKQQIKWLLRGRKLTKDDQLDVDITKALRSIRFSDRKPGKRLEEGDTLASIQLRPGSPGSSSEDSEDDQVQKESQEQAAPMHQVQEVRGEEPPLIVAPEEKEEDESESEEEPAAQVLVINGQLPEDDVEEEEDDPLGGATTDSLLGSSSDEEEQERDEEEQERDEEEQEHDEEEQEQGEEEREQVEEEMDQEDSAPVDKMDLDN